MPFNKVIIMGNLTRDPEVKALPSGNSAARLSVAVNRQFSDKDGNKREEVTFVEVDAFGKQAEVIGKFFSKGKPILVEGRLKLDQWEDKKTGEKKSRLGVVLENFSFVGGDRDKGDRDGEGGEAAPAQRAPRAGNATQRQSTIPGTSTPAGYGEGDDVPF